MLKYLFLVLLLFPVPSIVAISVFTYLNDEMINIGKYSLPNPLFKEVYLNYFLDLKVATCSLGHVGFKNIYQTKKLNFLSIVYNIVLSIYPAFRKNSRTG